MDSRSTLKYVFRRNGNHYCAFRCFPISESFQALIHLLYRRQAGGSQS